MNLHFEFNTGVSADLRKLTIIFIPIFEIRVQHIIRYEIDKFKLYLEIAKMGSDN